MEKMITCLVAGIVLLAAIGLSSWHLRVRKSHHRKELPPADYDFFRRQFRRRIQVSAMLGVLAVLLAASAWVEIAMVNIFLYLVMLLLAFWIVLLALADAIVSRAHYGRLRCDYIVERAKLEAEANRLRNVGGNGKVRGEQAKRTSPDSE